MDRVETPVSVDTSHTTQCMDHTQAPLAVRITVAGFFTAISALILYTIGFAHSTTLHNAAHDVRHA